VFEFTAVEMLGYLASTFVVVSLAMSSVVRLRIISLVGSTLFLAYGVLIGSVPIVITNLAIACINVWYLRLELGHKRDLGVFPVPADSPFLTDFLAFHHHDVLRFQPDAPLPLDPTASAWLLTRDGLPAGVIAGRRDDDTLHVAIDYVMKAYRDSRLGEWVFGDGSRVFTSAGLRRVVSDPGADSHRRYLRQIGFRPDGDRYVLELSPRAR
jgi:hypothetical protein